MVLDSWCESEFEDFILARLFIVRLKAKRKTSLPYFPRAQRAGEVKDWFDPWPTLTFTNESFFSSLRIPYRNNIRMARKIIRFILLRKYYVRSANATQIKFTIYQLSKDTKLVLVDTCVYNLLFYSLLLNFNETIM